MAKRSDEPRGTRQRLTKARRSSLEPRGDEAYRTIVETSPDGIYQVDRNGHFLFVNESFATLFGYSREELRGKQSASLLCPAAAPAMRRMVGEVLSGKDVRDEAVFVHKDGHEVPVVFSATPLREGGQIIGLTGFLKDATERKRIEQALESSETHYRSLIENSQDAIVIVDGDGAIRYESSSIERVMGHRPETRTGKKIFEFLHPDDLANAVEDFTRLADEPGPTVHREVRVQHEDGSWRTLEVVGKNLLDDPVIAGIVVNLRDITQRKQMELALQESEEKWRSLVTSTPDRIMTLARDGTILYTNRVSPGYSVEKVIGTNAFDYLPPDARDSSRQAVEAVLSTGETRRYEGYTVIPDGTQLWFETSVVPMWSGGQVAAALLAMTDITKRKQAEEALQRAHDELESRVGERTAELEKANRELQREIRVRKRAEKALGESERQYREVADLLPQIVYEADTEGNLTFVSRKGYEATGYSQDDVRGGLNVLQLLVPEDRERGTRNVRAALGGIVSEGNEYTMLRKDGTTFPAVVYSSAIVRDGTVSGLRGIVVDITERKRLEEGLRESEQRFRSLIENALDVIVIIDDQGKIKYESPAIEHVLGYKPEALIGRHGFDFAHPDDTRRVEELFGALQNDPGAQGAIELHVRHGDGSWRRVEAIGRNLLSDPTVSGIVVNFRDITERKIAEEKLRELYEEERNLRMRVEAEMKRRIEFTRALAHELKTPLTSVIASSDILASECSEEPMLGLADNIRRGASNLNRRIDELLDVARGEVGMLQLRVESVDLLELLRQTAEGMTPAAYRHGQSLEISLPASIPTVRADASRVQQIVTNLLDNAIKFTPKGGKITLRAQEKNGALTVEVQDTGQGVPEKEQGHLFEPYYRREKDRDNLSGLGLGLSLCKALVELHGGQIWVRSREGVGSTFGFSLPSGAATPEEKEPLRDASLWKVLIIEDNQEIVDSIALSFRLRWPEAQLVSTGLGEEGIEMVEAEAPDVVILDLGLPDLGGFEVLRRIRLFSSVPVVILTVKDDEADMVRGLEWGADDYIVKPFRQLELLARLKVQMRKHAAADDEAPTVCGPLRLDPSTYQLAHGRKQISLTVVEGRIMQHLMANADNVVTHSRLAEAVWGEDYPGALDSLRVYIRYLRQKIEADPSNPEIILTKAGVGYSLAKPR